VDVLDEIGRAGLDCRVVSIEPGGNEVDLIFLESEPGSAAANSMEESSYLTWSVVAIGQAEVRHPHQVLAPCNLS